MNELSLFTGAGGGLLGTHLLGWKAIGYVEWNEYCQQVIRARIDDGILPVAPIFTDVREFVQSGAAREYRGFADVVSGGFPCQPFSVAGKQQGAADPRNMWPATIDVIRAVRPKYAFLENVPAILSSGYFGTVIGDLAESGYDCRWCVLGGANVGEVIDGKRLWIVASSTHGARLEGLDIYKFAITGTEESFRRKFTRAVGAMLQPDDYARIKRGSDELAAGMDRLKAIGNGQVPAVAAAAWRLLTQE